MRVLLDEHLPMRLATRLVGHSVSTVQGEGWSGAENGTLLAKAVDAGFEVLVTNDKSIEYQQNIAKLQLAVVVFGAPSNKIEDLEPLVPSVLAAIQTIGPGELRHATG
ncbi:MAG TPA: DUF5615 family PIN-like protein [Fimbriimonadaceae bacterium]|nr:DUF5615 family PIN-like protein [Fimbriimonadaceae bacterium]